jgi:hypothetical protein
MRIVTWKCAGAYLFGAVWLIYSVCPPFLSYDSYWPLATALSIVERGTTTVDLLVPASPPEARYGLECSGTITYLAFSNRCNEHWYSIYPIGTPVLVAPVLAAMKGAVAVIGPVAPHTGFFARREVAAFFSGDLLGGRPLTELWCASLFGALAVWIQFRIALLFLPRATAMLLALLFAFGTSEWSVASRNLFPQGLTVLLLSAALYFLLAGQPGALAGLFLALAFAVRPSNAVACVAIAIYVAAHQRRYLMRFLLGAAPVAAAFFGYQWWIKHSLIPLYLRTALNPYPPLEGAAMHLFSPSRGLLVFTPIVMVSVAGAILAWRRRWCFPLAPYLMAIVIAHAALISWGWPGHGYGPRFFTDLTPLFVLFLIPAIQWWQETHGAGRRVTAAAFAALALWGVFTHGHGATSIAANQWSALPVNVDTARWRVWDWSDPQFLRGLK